MAPPSRMRISCTLANVLVVVLTFQAPSVRADSCTAGCTGVRGMYSATFLFDAGYQKVTATCHEKAPQDCPLIAPNVFRCCDEFTFTIFQFTCLPVACEPEVHITHDSAINVYRYRGILRTDLLDWESTTLVSCDSLDGPTTLAEVAFTPPSTYRLDSLEVCYDFFARCQTAGSVCGDPKLVGGDGVAFYFHGRRDQNFCLVSDSDVHVNAHFIGKRPAGRTRDFTWVQALGFVFGSHTLTVAANPRVALWDSKIDHLEFVYNSEALALNVTSSWTSGAMTLTRSGEPNVVDVDIKGKMGVTLNAVPVGKHESDVHHYGIIMGKDCFAHLDMQFRFNHLSSKVNGVLGQTYQQGFVNPTKRGVAMPVMGGADQFQSSSLVATDCAVSQYTGHTTPALSLGSAMPRVNSARCVGGSSLPNGVPSGITCRR